jgi:hypothetical protein
MWKKLTVDLKTRRAHIGLSRLARYASAKGIEPEEIDDTTIEAFITAVRNETLHRKPNDLHRKVALIWNEAAWSQKCSSCGKASSTNLTTGSFDHVVVAPSCHPPSISCRLFSASAALS